MVNRMSLWQKMYSDTSELTKPAQMEQILGEDTITEFQSLLKSAICTFLEGGELHIGIKIYVDQELNHAMVEKMKLNPPTNDESLESWLMQNLWRKEVWDRIQLC